MNIIISGDVLPTPNNEELFCNGDILNLVGNEIVEIYRKADFRISNLEGPLTDKENGIEKSGPVIKGSSSSIKGIKALEIDCVSIANNHILDYGETGMLDTIDVLKENGIGYVGAGKNLEDACTPHIFVLEGVKIGLFSCAEYEFTMATDSRGGANPFDALDIVDKIRSLKRQCDIVIVLYHGGKEYYRYPVPYVQKRCRKMAEAGADFIFCQHSHCIGTYEEYKGCGILYGQGNFIFCREDNEYTHSGLLVRIILEGRNKNIEFIPVVRKGEKVRIADSNEKEEIMNNFAERSEQAKNAEFLQKKYREFALSMVEIYLKYNIGLFWNILKKLRLEKYLLKIYRKHHYLFILNELRCEAHADIYREGIEGLLEDSDAKSVLGSRK